MIEVAATDLKNTIETEFAFLTKNFGFGEYEISHQDEDEITILVRGDATGVRIVLDLREQYPFVFISKLSTDKKVPKRLGEITPDTEINEFDLDDLVWYCSREEPASNKQNLLKGIKVQAKNLKEYGTEVLSGDFSIFKELNKIVKKRACQAAYEKWGNNAEKLGWTKEFLSKESNPLVELLGQFSEKSVEVREMPRKCAKKQKKPNSRGRHR